MVRHSSRLCDLSFPLLSFILISCLLDINHQSYFILLIPLLPCIPFFLAKIVYLMLTVPQCILSTLVNKLWVLPARVFGQSQVINEAYDIRLNKLGNKKIQGSLEGHLTQEGL